jgi:hypothetical protein
MASLARSQMHVIASVASEKFRFAKRSCSEKFRFAKRSRLKKFRFAKRSRLEKFRFAKRRPGEISLCERVLIFLINVGTFGTAFVSFKLIRPYDCLHPITPGSEFRSSPGLPS